MGGSAATDRGAAYLETRGVLRVGGLEAHAFLQGLVTNDMDAIGEGRAIYAALLTPQGKFLFDFFIVSDGADADSFLLDCDGARAADLAKRLTFYKLRADVGIENVSDTLGVAALWSEDAPASLGLAGSAGAAGAAGDKLGGRAFVDPRLAALGVRAILPRREITAACKAAGYPLTGEAGYHRRRLALGVPDGALDLEPERSFPLEANFDELNAIDFKKGCFIGQEVTSRTKRRGSVRKRLLPVRVDGDLPAPGAAVISEGREVGTVYSGAGNRALALLRLDRARAGELVSGDSRLTAEAPYWASFDLPSPGDDAPDAA